MKNGVTENALLQKSYRQACAILKVEMRYNFVFQQNLLVECQELWIESELLNSKYSFATN